MTYLPLMFEAMTAMNSISGTSPIYPRNSKKGLANPAASYLPTQIKLIRYPSWILMNTSLALRPIGSLFLAKKHEIH